MKKAYNDSGVDWLEVVIPPQAEDEAEYTLRVHMTFLLSNWKCLFGNGCPGMFGKQSSTYPDDAGCCVDSFYFSDPEEEKFVEKQMARLTDDDWDQNLRKHVEKNGFKHVINRGKDVVDDLGEEVIDGYKVKGKVVDGACVFQNRNDGSTGKPGCAFHHLSQRTGESHVDVMPKVCWQLPIRYGETAENSNVYELRPWDTAQWQPDEYEFSDASMSHHWWCIDTPDAYIGKEPVYKTLKEELVATIGQREYDIVVAAVEERLARGNTYGNMPGATLNDGRPLIPLLVGNREPRREPSYFPAHLEQLKAADDQADSPAEQGRTD